LSDFFLFKVFLSELAGILAIFAKYYFGIAQFLSTKKDPQLRAFLCLYFITTFNYI